MDGEAFLKFMKYAGILKETVRKGWVEKVGIKDAESVAEHSYRVALISAAMAIESNVDVGKAVVMAILHDLHESITGDRTPEEEKPNEEEAFLKVVSDLNPRLRETLYTIWKEYREGSSKEAKIVRQADKLEMAVQALEYRGLGYSEELLMEFLRSAEKGIHDDEFKNIMEVIRNRFFKH